MEIFTHKKTINVEKCRLNGHHAILPLGFVLVQYILLVYIPFEHFSFAKIGVAYQEAD